MNNNHYTSKKDILKILTEEEYELLMFEHQLVFKSFINSVIKKEKMKYYTHRSEAGFGIPYTVYAKFTPADIARIFNAEIKTAYDVERTGKLQQYYIVDYSQSCFNNLRNRIEKSFLRRSCSVNKIKAKHIC